MGLNLSVAYPQSLSPVMISCPFCSCELARIRKPWRKTVIGLWSHISHMVVGVVCSNTISVETNYRFQIVCSTFRISFSKVSCKP